MSTKDKIRCRCRCGSEREVRAGEIISGHSNSCRSCACRLKALKTSKARRVAIAKKASSAAKAAVAARVNADPYRAKYGEALDYTKRLGASIKQRCTNPNCIGFSNYGGRGVNFGFPNVRSFAEWLLDNLGPKPGASHSIDRIDNTGHYEPGNLRWATRAEQARNKRKYKRTNAGERIRALKERRPDLTYETIRLWITQGATDEEIIQRKKYARPGL